MPLYHGQTNDTSKCVLNPLSSSIPSFVRITRLDVLGLLHRRRWVASSTMVHYRLAVIGGDIVRDRPSARQEMAVMAGDIVFATGARRSIR